MRNFSGAKAEQKFKERQSEHNSILLVEPAIKEDLLNEEFCTQDGQPVKYRKIPGAFLVGIKGYGMIKFERGKGETINDVLGVH
jgi:hypothetical protein